MQKSLIYQSDERWKFWMWVGTWASITDVATQQSVVKAPSTQYKCATSSRHVITIDQVSSYTIFQHEANVVIQRGRSTNIQFVQGIFPSARNLRVMKQQCASWPDIPVPRSILSKTLLWLFKVLYLCKSKSISSVHVCCTLIWSVICSYAVVK